MFRAACANLYAFCHKRFYERSDAFQEIFWFLQDFVVSLHDGIEVVPAWLSALVVLTVWLCVCPGK